MKKSINIMLLVHALFLISCKPMEIKLMNQLGNRIRINTESESIVVGLTKVSADMPCASDKTYFWFEKGKIISTQGGCSGKLLHGNYAAHDRLTKQLITQGDYDNGLKTGKWLLWGTNGLLTQSQQWKNGFQNGKTIIYDSLGIEKASIKFKNGLEVKPKESKVGNWVVKRFQKVFKGKKK